MNKSLKIIFLCYVILSLSFIYINNKKKIRYEKIYKNFNKEKKEKYKILGSLVDLSEFKNIKNNKLFIGKNDKYKYLLILVIPKIYCGQCLHGILKYFNNLSEIKINSVAIGYKKNNMKIIKNKYFIKKKVYFISNYKWFKKAGMLKGPYLLLVDANTKKVLNLYKNDNIKSVSAFFGFVDKL